MTSFLCAALVSAGEQIKSYTVCAHCKLVCFLSVLLSLSTLSVILISTALYPTYDDEVLMVAGTNTSTLI